MTYNGGERGSRRLGAHKHTRGGGAEGRKGKGGPRNKESEVRGLEYGSNTYKRII